MTTATTSKLPILYTEPLPDAAVDLRAHLRETLRRVRRSAGNTDMTLGYNLKGEAGEWAVYPEGYYTKEYKRKPHRQGPWFVQEWHRPQTPPFSSDKVGDEKQFSTEQEAWDWIREEHARRVDATLSDRAARKHAEVEKQITLKEAELALLRQKSAAWRMLT